MVCGLLASFAFGEVRAQSYFDDSDYYGLPWVKNVSRPNKIDNGLEGRHLAIWASHGRYFDNKTGLKVGFKAAGGIRTTEDAVKYYTLVKEILGEEWLNNGLFRIGASSLANALFASMTGSDAKPF